jgi:hypothetical protein
MKKNPITWAREKLIHEKLESKISWHCPLQNTSGTLGTCVSVLVKPEHVICISKQFSSRTCNVYVPQSIHTEWQWPISGVHVIHFIMMEKSALTGEGGECTPIPFHSIVTATYKVAVYTPAERTDTLPLFHLYTYMYSVVCTILHNIQYVWILCMESLDAWPYLTLKILVQFI